MNTQTNIKCINCGTFNQNLDYCSNCGQLINPELLRKKSIQERKKSIQEQFSKSKIEIQNTLFYQLKNHRFWIVRVFATIVYSVWVIVMAIGSFLAWLAAAISA